MTFSRRTFLAGGASTVFASTAGLAGCGGGVVEGDGLTPFSSLRTTSPTSLFGTELTRETPLSVGALLLQSIIYEGWAQGSADPAFFGIETMAQRGLEWARAQVTTLSCPVLDTLPVAQWRTQGWKEEFWCCREMAAAVLKRAAAAGLKLQLAFFLSDVAANAGTQKRPAAWQGFDAQRLAAAVEDHARTTAQYFKSKGLQIDIFEFGSECDFRLCGYELKSAPPGVIWNESPDWIFDTLWSNYVPLFKAGIAGVRSVFPSASIVLHMAAFGYSPGNLYPKSFYAKMKEAGVQYDIAGLSYPYLFGGSPVLPQPYFEEADFQSTLRDIKALGKRIQITEFSYPAAPNGITASQAPYPFTPEGQAQFIQNFAASVRGKAERINYFWPDFFLGINGPGGSPAFLESSGLFSSATTSRVGLNACSHIPADRLFDWAQARYPELFPLAASSASGSGYYYRFYPPTATYLGLRDGTTRIVLHDGGKWNFFEVGTIADFLPAAAAAGY
jgi:hypothetical protein